MRTNSDAFVRKACFDALETLSLDAVNEYVELVAMRNEFARALGFEDFYAYKLHISEGMAKNDVLRYHKPKKWYRFFNGFGLLYILGILKSKFNVFRL